MASSLRGTLFSSKTLSDDDYDIDESDSDNDDNDDDFYITRSTWVVSGTLFSSKTLFNSAETPTEIYLRSPLSR